MMQAKKRKQNAQKQGSAVQSYMRVTIFLCIALLAVAFAQYHIADKQKNMLLVTFMTDRQMSLQADILSDVDVFLKKQDSDTLQRIRDNAMALQRLEAQIIERMQLASWFAMPKVNLANFEKIKNLTIQGISFAAYAEAQQDGNARDLARDIQGMHKDGVPDTWRGEIRHYIEAVQREVDALVYGSYALYALLLGFLIFQALTQIVPLIKETDELRTQIKEMAATDMLTGIYNRAMLFKLGNMLISAAKRHKQELTMLVVDVDDFEKLNDKYGRAAGDIMLKLLAEELATCLRNSDVLGRFGGDEFAILLPATDEYRAAYVAEKLRAAVEALAYEQNDTQIMMTVSIGLVEIQQHHATPDDMLRAAQAALQKAKQDGRNRCVAFSTMNEDATLVPATAV